MTQLIKPIFLCLVPPFFPLCLFPKVKKLVSRHSTDFTMCEVNVKAAQELPAQSFSDLNGFKQ